MTTALPHVLVAEDNQLVRDAMRVLFTETGRRVSTGGRVADIVEIMRTDPADLLLLDLGLADGDGFEVLRLLREHDAMPRVCVALTGRDEPSITARCREEGCAAVLLKPVPTRELLRMADAWLAPGRGT